METIELMKEIIYSRQLIYNIDCHITDKCNQKCVSCGHFCPLVPKDVKHKSLEELETNFSLLSQHSNTFYNLTLTGGECTLHPELSDIICLARKYFPNNKISLYTNGTNFNKLEKIKDVLDENGIYVISSYYPSVGDKVFDIKDKVNCNYEIRKSAEIFYKTFFCGEKCTTDDEILHCGSRGICCQIVDGKLYACQYAAFFPYFDNFFKGKHSLQMSETDGLDLRNNPSDKEIIDFLYNKKMDICPHCLDAKRFRGYYVNNVEWGDSNKEIDEWYVQEFPKNNFENYI